MANEEASHRHFNDGSPPRNAWVIASLPGSPSLISSDFQTRWIVLIEHPHESEKLFPDEGEECFLAFKHIFAIRGEIYNPGLVKAERIANPFEDFEALRDYSHHAAFNVTMDYLADPVTKQKFNPLATLAVQQPFGITNPTPLTSVNAVKVNLRVSAQLVTHDAELKALALLTSHERDLTPLEKRARLAFEYIIDFRRAPHSTVNLFKELPHMDSPAANPNTPAFLKQVYSLQNEDHKKVYEQLRAIPAGLGIIQGCPGAGKTALNAFIAAMALSQPIEEAVNGKKRPRRVKVLYLIDVNEPCDDAANRVFRILRDSGIDRKVVRVRGCAREMSRSAKLHPAHQSQPGPAKGPDFTTGFLRQAHLARQGLGSRSDLDKAPSLDEAAWETYEANRNHYKGLSKLLDRLEQGATKTKKTAAELRGRVANLYFAVIKNADFIATTPVGASGQLSSLFHPDLVFIDEAAHARELTSLIPLAFCPARAYLLTGDTRQTRPFVQGASMNAREVREKGLQQNPYAKQLMVSTMERADLAGAIKSKLLITHRMYGNLHSLASELFYDGQLQPGMSDSDRFPPPVQHIQRWLDQFTNGRCLVPRVLVNHLGAVEKRDRASFYNPAHESVVKQRCVELLSDPFFRRVDKHDEPGRILIITPYKAALIRYKQFTADLAPQFQGRLGVELRRGTTEARTVDSAQGHEADFVFIDTVRTATAGFLNDPKRLCVMLTRARAVATDPPQNTPAPPQSKAWIAGPVVGVTCAVAFLVLGFWFLRRRRRRRKSGPETADGKYDGKGKYEKAELHANDVPPHPAMELEGSYPKPIPELSANGIAAGELFVSENRPVAEMPEKHI
ncbi:Regulator of nonsense transcripts 1 [Colletotrichum trifolii]|uniref:Regulator of nonsense transcripts 1 n=1 Tax=Colletotrichum trifolii TaxID=5466 RepID=A0A4V6QEY2_COLTR|nr:Regulator of nonsense transcripts 1 [Colletotrichum trifolii]